MKAYFAGGCFWCISAPFSSLDGVTGVKCGYSGGDEVNPTYEQVKSQTTGHRETIEIEYDENVVSYSNLLDVFFENIDPFDKDGQFIDRGHSYSTAVYYNSDEEKRIATEKLMALSQTTNKECFVAIEPSKEFYKAEEYHQNYAIKHPEEFERELIESGRKHK